MSSTRVGVRFVLMTGVVLAILLGAAAPASAHPTLLVTTPEAGYSVASAPGQVTLVFDEPVSADARAVRIENEHGDQVRTSGVSREQGGRRLVTRILDNLTAGRYVVRWRVTAQDGDVVDADFDFAVATSGAGLRGLDTPTTAAFPLVSILRWLFFVAVAAVIGGLAGERIARRAAPGAVVPRSLVRPAAVVGALAAAALAVQLIVVTNSVGRAGYLLGLEALGLAAVAVLGGRWRPWRLAPPILLVLAAEALRNHLGTQRGIVGAVLIAIHLVAIAVWGGALLHLVRVAHANRSMGNRVRAAFIAYSRLALVLFLVVVTSGTIAALLLVPNLHALTSTSYGWTLLVKLCLVLVVVVLAWVNRHRLVGSSPLLSRSAGREAVVLAAVVAASAALVSLPTPAPATADIGYPPPVSGPVVRMGTLAGQIAVGIAASENRLEVRLRVPDEGNQVTETKPPDYRVTARVSGAVPATTVALRPCGPGCFVGPVAWRSGTSYVDLRADATGWTGGAAVLPIQWAPVVADDVLARVRVAMLAQRSIRVVETVTSDTSRSGPGPQTVTTTGRELLASDPYGSPPDPQVVELERPDGGKVLLFGLPAEGIQVELEVDASYRIVREKLSAPKHLTQRTFSYPRE